MKSLKERFMLDPPVVSSLGENGPINGSKSMILDTLTADKKMDGKVENKSIEASATPGTDGSIL